MFSVRSLRHRLVIGMTVMLLLILAAAVTAIYHSMLATERMDTIVEGIEPTRAIVLRLQEKQVDAGKRVAAYLNTRDPAHLDGLQVAIDQFQLNIKRFLGMARGDEAMALGGRIQAKFDEYARLSQRLTALEITISRRTTDLMRIADHLHSLLRDDAADRVALARFRAEAARGLEPHLYETERALLGFLSTLDESWVARAEWASSRFLDQHRNYTSRFVSPEERRALNEIKQSFAASQSAVSDVLEAYREQRGQLARFNAVQAEVDTLLGDHLIPLVSAELARARDEATRVLDRGTVFLALFLFSCLLLGAGIAFVTVRGVSRPVTQLVGMAHDIAEGRSLNSFEPTPEDEFGAVRGAMVDMAGKLDAERQALRRRGEELELANRSLVAANEQARAAIEAKSAFLATMSHEIRTPLNAVIGMCELIQDTPLDPTQSEYAATIRVSAVSLLDVINSILDFSKLEAGKMEREEIEFEIEEMLDDVFDVVGLAARKKNLPVAFAIAAAVPRRVRGDPIRIKQILLNLLGNAVKFTERGSVSMKIDSLGIVGQELDLSFSVTDTGIGIAPEVLDRLFEPFTQADGSTTRRYGGTGLGLALSAGLARLLGGRIAARSVQGSGSCFSLMVRVGLAAGTENPTDPLLRGRRVLLVDDQEMNLALYSRRIEAEGAQVHAFTSPHDALQWLRDAPLVDVAIVDHFMHGMDGCAFERAARNIGRHAYLPMILASSSQSRIGADEGEAFAACLQKPIRARLLLDTVLRVLEAPRKEPARKPPDVLPGSHGNAGTHAGTSAMRVLAVDDNDINLSLVSKLLVKMGVEVEAVSNGIDALLALERARFDVVLLDVQMPGMDGHEAAREIILRHGLSRPRIIALTANALKGDREKCIQAGMDEYLSKPITGEALARALGVTNWPGSRSTAVTAPLVDREIVADVLQLFEGDREGLGRIIDEFFSEATRLVADLVHSAERRDIARLDEQAHKLKGLAGSVGATRLSALGAALTRLAREADWLSIGSTVASTAACVNETRVALPSAYLQAETQG